MASKRKLREALEDIGTVCANYANPWNCVNMGRSKDADFTADRWCDQCVAREGLK